ncbi:porin family protein [Polaribacter tangerinus]|uniref:porin family protein n=1 Tax=Polaribacter tangerinus TaxID=1920034 RepID=UPI000B4B4FBA|nr:porin family protein [Polaribacter tangerinus]
MKKVILLVCLAFGISQTSSAQINFGLKGGINYNSNSIKEVGTDVFDGAKSKTGYHAGIWLRAKIPVLGIYVRPELVYTNLENEIVYKTTGNSATYSFQKIDIPVLLGKKIFGVGNIFVGPSFQYILDSGFSFSDISDVDTDNFTVGLQFGAGIEIGKIGVDVRMERGFSGIESRIVGNTGINNFDTRVNQVIIGLSYKL